MLTAHDNRYPLNDRLHAAIVMARLHNAVFTALLCLVIVAPGVHGGILDAARSLFNGNKGGEGEPATAITGEPAAGANGLEADLAAFYATVNPEKVPSAPALAAKYAGRADVLLLSAENNNVVHVP